MLWQLVVFILRLRGLPPVVLGTPTEDHPGLVQIWTFHRQIYSQISQLMHSTQFTMLFEPIWAFCLVLNSRQLFRETLLCKIRFGVFKDALKTDLSFGEYLLTRLGVFRRNQHAHRRGKGREQSFKLVLRNLKLGQVHIMKSASRVYQLRAQLKT